MDIVWQWLGLWFSAFSSATILPGTSDVVLLAFVNANPQLWLGALLLATLGNGMGSMVSYGMGRLVPDKHRPSERIHGWIQKYGVWALLMSWVPFVGDGLAAAEFLAVEPDVGAGQVCPLCGVGIGFFCGDLRRLCRVCPSCASAHRTP